MAWAVVAKTPGGDAEDHMTEFGDISRSTPPTPLPRWKRIFDLTLIWLTAPIWFLMMVGMIALVKAVSPGPAIYRQRRVGYEGREFTIYKFRSMHVNSDVCGHEHYVQDLIGSNKPMTKLDEGDARVIPLGRLLRALALDELPQIFNVLQGDMSLVGPRPCTLAEFGRYQPEHRRRVAVLPGLTGLWQVCGKNKLTFDQMIELDVRYAETMSLGLDLRIVFRTIPTLFGQLAASLCRRRFQVASYAVNENKPSKTATTVRAMS